MTQMWAWVTVHSETEQSITGMDGLPLVAQQETVIRKFAPMLRRLAKATGKPQRLIRFDRVTTVDQIDP
jgi:hypothetical protein